MPKPAPLTKDEILYYFSLLTEEVTDYNCGTLCSNAGGGIPACCTQDNAVPFLYKAEFDYISSKTDMWSRWKPLTSYEKKLKKDSETRDTFFCVCKGVEFCERDYRSISCRIFPLEPFIDNRGVFIGLTFMDEFKDKCPLTRRGRDIRQAFIDQHFTFWEKIMLRREDEREIYIRSSRALRTKAKKTGEKITVLFPTHMKNSGLKKYIV